MKRGRAEIVKRIRYHKDDERVEEEYLRVFNKGTKHYQGMLEKYQHNWGHRFFWGWYVDKRDEKLNNGEYYYTLYDIEYNFFVYVFHSWTCNTGRLFQCRREVEEYIATFPHLYYTPLDRGLAPAYREKTNAKAREAIRAWFICAGRLGIQKDVARLIGRKCWADRFLWME